MALISDVRKGIEELLEDEVGIKLYFRLKTSDGEKIKFANIADETLKDSDDEETTSEELLGGFENALLKKLSEYEDDEAILELSSADERVNALYTYDLDTLPEEMLLLKEVMQDNKTYEIFQFSEDSLSTIAAFLIVIGNAEKKVALYKQQYPISLLKRDKCMLTPVPHKNRLARVKADILRVDFNFQFFAYEDSVYVNEIESIEKICGFQEIIKKEAEKSIEAIEAVDLLEDSEVLMDELDNMAFARKLTKIYKNSKVVGKVAKQDIIDFTQRHPFFRKNPLKLNATGDKFILDTKRSKNTFIKLLNDDLLTSDLTKAQYESLAKNDVG